MLATEAANFRKNQQHRFGERAYMGGAPGGQRESVFFLQSNIKPLK
jgi:hypothetical protein